MSDFGTLYDYALSLEADIPPTTLMAMENRPKFMRQFPMEAPAADTKETPRATTPAESPRAGSKKD